MKVVEIGIKRKCGRGLKWFTLQRSRNLPITGANLQTKANEFAELFEEKSFVCSNGWLDRFKKRHNIRSGKVVGEAASVRSSDINHWMESVRPDIIRNYDEKDIFSTPMKHVCFTSSLQIKL
ncbi:hypothetical protein AVEN_76236-1 [Araneus ventricosus]|uniref:HTH CENPB-type domain-containing protein n=1 Tax=Araneus ventricosus TaxID=182803 RepID=A0A4Y2UP29_ARAVE|nr:hypothetical protein AVEN_76236-1 [Araneus ventricosus]